MEITSSQIYLRKFGSHLTRMARWSHSERDRNQEQWQEHVCPSRSTFTAWPPAVAWKSRPILQ